MRHRILHAVAASLVGAAIAVIQGAVSPAPLVAHGGGLDSRGCHNDRARGEYHCHRGPLAGQAFRSSIEAIEALAKLQGAAPATPAAKPASLPPATRAGVAAPFAPAAAPAASSVCGLDRRGFEQLVSLRMQNYESTGDTWSPRAARWRTEIAGNIAAGKPTAALDAAFGRYGRYCAEGDNFMAGMVVGEWVGLGLRAP